MTKSYLKIKINPTDFKLFEVPGEVYVYVIQLENAIKNKNFTPIKTLYPERFKNV